MRTVTQQPGHYRRPRFSPDGATIVYELAGGGGLTSNRWSDADRHLPRPRRRRRGDPDPRRRRQPAFRRRLGPRLPRGQRAAEAQADQRRSRAAATGATMPRARWSPTTRSRRTAARSPSARITISSSRPSSAAPGAARRRRARLASCRSPASPPTAAAYPTGRDGGRLAWSLGPTLYSADTADLLRTAPGGAAYAAPTTGTSLVDHRRRRRADRARSPWSARAIVTMADEDGGDHRRRRDPDRRQPHPRGRPRAARSPFPPARAGRRRRQDDHPRPDRRPRPWRPGRGRSHPAAELVGHVAPRARRHHRPRPVEHGERDLRRRRDAARRHHPRAAHLLVGRDRLRRPLARAATR